MNANIEKFRHELNRVFDDNLHTKQWHNVFDYIIIGLIVLSTVEVFLSTYDGIAIFAVPAGLIGSAFTEVLPPEMLKRNIGHDFGFGDYID